MQTKSPTRSDYMNNHCSYADYYRAVANTAGLRAPADLVERARNSKDEHYNDIPLSRWDAAAAGCITALSRAFKEHGDFNSLAGGVCVFKQLVRDAIDGRAQ